MKSVARRRQRMAKLLLVLQFFGARAHALNDACNRGHIFFGPALGSYAAIRQSCAWLTRVQWKTAAPRSFGERQINHTSEDLDCTRGSRRKMAPVIVAAPAPSAVVVLSERAGPRVLAKLPSDLSPTQPRHLRSKN